MDERAELIRRIDAVEAAADQLRMDTSLDSLLSLPLTVQQLKVLAVIVAGGGDSTAQKVAAVLKVSLATVSGIVDRLVDHDVVARVADERDRRSRRLVATGHGRQLLENLLMESDRFRRAALVAMELEDLRALARGLEAFMRLAFGVKGDGIGGVPD